MCNEPINECASSPCSNGGSCEDLINGYKCHCDPAWEGPECQYRAGHAPAVALRPRVTSTTRSPVSSIFTSTRKVAPRTAKSMQRGAQSDGDVELTQPQLILIVCLASGIPLCLLLALVSILLYRRCRRRVDGGDKSEEVRQNVINGMNNRIHNAVGNNHPGKGELYPTTEKKVVNEMDSAPPPLLSLDLKNSASTALAAPKVLHKDMIKDINTAKERERLNRVNALHTGRQPSALTASEQQYIQYYHQERHCSNVDSHVGGTTLRATTPVHTNNSTIDTNSSSIPTVCSTVLQNTQQQPSDTISISSIDCSEYIR